MYDDVLEQAKEVVFEKLKESPLKIDVSEILNQFERVQHALLNMINSDDKDFNLKIKTGTILIMSIYGKSIQGKSIKAFSKNDWKDVYENVVDYAVIMDDEEYSKLVFLLYAEYIDASVEVISSVASEDTVCDIHSLADEIRLKAELFEKDEITEVQYVEDCLWISLEAIIKIISATVSAAVGKISSEEYAKLAEVIPVFAFQVARFTVYKKESVLLDEYLDEQKTLDEDLEEMFKKFSDEIMVEADRMYAVINNAFDCDVRQSLQNSIELARTVGVDDSDILNDENDVDDFFMG